MSEISLILSNDSGSYQALFGQFIESAVADTFEDRVLAQQAATSAQADAVQTAEDRVASSNSAATATAAATAAGGSATSASGSASAASISATNASNSASAAAGSASAAGVSATNASNSATSASTSAANAAAVLASALTKANNLSDVANPATARSNIGAAATSGSLSQFAATSSAQLAALLSDETGSGSAVFGTGPTLNQPNIVGAVNGGNAAAGSVGEFVSTQTGSAVTLTNGAATNVLSLLLGPGDWDVTGLVQFNGGSGITLTLITCGISTVSGSRGVFGTEQVLQAGFTTGAGQVLASMPTRVSISVATTIYVTTFASFSGGTPTAHGFVRARRVR